MESASILKEEFEEKLLQIAAATDAFEGYAHPHAARIAVLADALAQKFNLASHDRFSLQQAALVHDIGETLMNREYFKARRLLRADERVDMQRHPVIGEQEAAKQGLSRAVQLLVRWHHEWWNGTGYPDALEQEHIPLAARILRVADTYAALTDDRPYKAAISAEEARKYLVEWAGIEFDPKIVKAFLALENLQELESYAASNEKPTPEAEISEQIAPEIFAAPEPDNSEMGEPQAAETVNSQIPEAEENSGKDAEQDKVYTQFWDNYK
ncbi:MAG TPA: HD domain-containing phosphohydrolase [Pyrinomonadaceae bacterium]|jgi:HD-GYP domain-containing protein (c-di-GMP phosphodiesterase class II)